MTSDDDYVPSSLFTVITDAGFPLVLCTIKHAEEHHWYQLWVLKRGKTLLDPPFENFRPDPQEYVTEVPLLSTWGGTVLRRFEVARLNEMAEWINERNSRWSVRACAVPPSGRFHQDGDTLMFQFSFSDLIVATEFKLRWG